MQEGCIYLTRFANEKEFQDFVCKMIGTNDITFGKNGGILNVGYSIFSFI